MLALGLAAVGVTFAVVRTVVLRPLPFRDPNRMVVLANEVPGFGSAPGVCTIAEFEVWQRSGLFEAAGASIPPITRLQGTAVRSGFTVRGSRLISFGCSELLPNWTELSRTRMRLRVTTTSLC